jgi:hypothetical protein
MGCLRAADEWSNGADHESKLTSLRASRLVLSCNRARLCGDQVQALSGMSGGAGERQNLRMSRGHIGPLSFLSCRKLVRHPGRQVPQIVPPGRSLMVRSRQRVRAKRGPMTGSTASRTMRPDLRPHPSRRLLRKLLRMRGGAQKKARRISPPGFSRVLMPID